MEEHLKNFDFFEKLEFGQIERKKINIEPDN